MRSRQGLVTAQAVADHLGISPKTVYEFAQRGLLPSIRIGERIVRFSWEDIDRYVEQAREAGR
jgi:excisionase family DNA binding protein